jgi:hypothetical protein
MRFNKMTKIWGRFAELDEGYRQYTYWMSGAGRAMGRDRVFLGFAVGG